jgi:hypothetical protein
MNIVDIIIIFFLILLLAYPIAYLIGRAWHKSYFYEVTNVSFFDKNRENK